MKRKYLLMLFLALVPSFVISAQFREGASYQELYDSETVVAMKSHVRTLTAAQLEGRKAGSEGEKAAAEYVTEVLKSYGVDVLSPSGGEVFGISKEGGDTLTSRNVIGFVQGYDRNLRDRYIVVGARLDNLGTMMMTVDGMPVEKILTGANGNASGLSMMLELARMVQTNSILFRRSVLFVAFGASTETFAGSWYFLNRSFADADKIDAMINLDMLGTGYKGFYAYSSSNADMNALVKGLSAELQPIQPEIVAAEPYPSDHRAFYDREIPSVFFTTGRYPEHNTERDTEKIIDYEMMERELEYLYNFTVTLANTEASLAFRPSEVPSRSKEYADVVSFYDCDQRPVFLNSADPVQFLNKWVYQYLKYPVSAVEQGIQGRVMVELVIEKDGKVTGVRVVKGVSPELDAEALKVVSASPKWKPGRLNGEKVRTVLTIPVEFRLEKKGSKSSFGIKK
ncbi:MAG: TonB family protein [Bacteroidales bacterium]|nr:TonB family protein [Bacteroidales bacterium]